MENLALLYRSEVSLVQGLRITNNVAIIVSCALQGNLEEAEIYQRYDACGLVSHYSAT